MCDLPTFVILVTLSYGVISDENILKMYFLDHALPKASHTTIFPHHTDSTSWPHHHEVTVLSQYDVDNDVAEHTTWSYHSEDTVLSQVFAHTVRSLWCHYDIPIMTSHVWVVWGHSDTSWIHHCEVTVLSQYDFKDTRDDHITMRSQCCHSMMSQVHEMTKWSWSHSAVTRRCPPCEVIMMSSWYQNYDITCVRYLLGHSDKRLPHHCEGTVLS